MQQPSKIFNRGLLRYVKGDATIPRGGAHRILMHVCNDIGGWGRGFVVALAKRYPKTEQQYRVWFRSQTDGRTPFKLGEIQMVELQSDLAVANMIAQHDIKAETDKDGKVIPPIRYDAFKSCLEKVAKEAKDRNSSVHAPRLGAGLAGGDWAEIEKIINETLIDRGINVTIYDFEEETKP